MHHSRRLVGALYRFALWPFGRMASRGGTPTFALSAIDNVSVVEDRLTLARRVGIGSRRCTPHPATCPARELP